MLKQICSQPWVREKFLSSPEEIVSMEKANAPDSDDDADLLERVLSFKQVNWGSGAGEVRLWWTRTPKEVIQENTCVLQISCMVHTLGSYNLQTG